jgi:hypothetical protein
MKNSAFRDVTPCSSCDNRLFGERYRVYLGVEALSPRLVDLCSVALAPNTPTRHSPTLLWQAPYYLLVWPSYHLYSGHTPPPIKSLVAHSPAICSHIMFFLSASQLLTFSRSRTLYTVKMKAKLFFERSVLTRSSRRHVLVK